MLFSLKKHMLLLSLLIFYTIKFINTNLKLSNEECNNIYIILFIMTLLLSFKINISDKVKKIFKIISFAIIPTMSFIIVELLNGTTPSSFSGKILFLNLIWYYIVYIIMYILLNHFRLSMFICNLFFFILGVSNYFILIFRGKSISLNDLLSLKTAINVVGQYNLELSYVLILSFVIFLLSCCIILKNTLPDASRKTYIVPKFIILLISISICVIAYSSSVFDYLKLEPITWYGNATYGYSLNFMIETNYNKVSKPIDYSKKAIQVAKDSYSNKINILSSHNVNSQSQDNTNSKNINVNETKPNIIVIMNESFSDLRVVNDFNTNEEYLPFFDSLYENTIKGYALCSIYGGGTANSEYEFLTGNTTAFLPKDSIVYQSYLNKKSSSLVSTLKNYGYKSIAVHPYHSSGWNRVQSYKLLGFDESLFIEDFDNPSYLRAYISDESSYDKLIELYKNKSENEPLFLFNVTMQNHGGYDFNYENNIYLSDYENKFPKTNQYLSVIKESDKQIQRLIEFFSNEDEPTVIMLFGDHQPRVENEFYESLYGKSIEDLSLEELQRMYTIPFFIWTNYDIEESNIELTSINYLSNYLLDAARLPGTNYNDFLKYLSTEIPAINSNGYLDSEGHFHNLMNTFQNKFTNQTLTDYQLIEYYNIFDNNSSKDSFFY